MRITPSPTNFEKSLHFIHHLFLQTIGRDQPEPEDDAASADLVISIFLDYFNSNSLSQPEPRLQPWLRLKAVGPSRRSHENEHREKFIQAASIGSDRRGAGCIDRLGQLPGSRSRFRRDHYGHG